MYSSVTVALAKTCFYLIMPLWKLLLFYCLYAEIKIKINNRPHYLSERAKKKIIIFWEGLSSQGNTNIYAIT